HTRCYRDWSSDVCSSDLGVFGIVQEHQRQPVQPQQPQAAVDGASDLLAAELTGLQIAVRLGAHDVAGGQAAEFPQHQADPALALPISVGRGGIEKIDRVLEYQ